MYEHPQKHTLGDLVAALLVTMIVVVLAIAFYRIIPPETPAPKLIEKPPALTPQQILARRVKGASGWLAKADRGMYVRLDFTTQVRGRVVITVTIQNRDSRPHLLPVVRLADDQGNIHGRDVSYRSDRSLRILQQVNPGTAVTGEVAFLVPAGRKYAVMVPGKDNALIPVTLAQEVVR